jgi:hypothetical protein
MSTEIQKITLKPLATFQSTMDDLILLVNDYSNLVVTDETLDESKKARASLRDKRFEIQRIEKQNTDQLNDLKDQNWENAKKLIAIITTAEAKIDSGIKAIEERKAAIKAEKERIEREKIEAEIKVEQERLAKIEQERIAAIEAAQKAEAERLAALQLEIDERNRVEQDRLNKIKADQEVKELAILTQQKRIQAEQAEREAKIKADQEAIDRQKRDLEASRQHEANEKLRIAELEQARKEATEKARVEMEIRAKREAEEKANAEMKVKMELERQEILKPDKEKLQDLSARIAAIQLPEFKFKMAASIAASVQIKLLDVTQFIDTELKKL